MKTAAPTSTLFALLFTSSFAFAQPAEGGGAEEGGQEPPLMAFEWVEGPSVGRLGEHAEIAVPEGYRFVGAADTRRLLEAMGNPTSGQELGFLGPDNLEWFVVFDFDPVGFVKDDEKDDLDAGKILEALKEGNKHSNEVRKARGWEPVELVGWVTKPQYNEATHNLEWATRLRSASGDSVNHNTRLLGRRGVMEATLVTDPELLEASLAPFRALLGGFNYREGHRYAEYQKGDKIAEYGLMALVAGGAGALAVKSGLFAKLFKGFGKLIIFGVVAIGGLFAKLFGRKREE